MATGALPGPEHGGRLRAFLGITDEVDDLNDAGFRSWRERGTDDALAALRDANDRLVAALEALPPAVILSGDGPEGLHPFFWQPGVNHLRQHRPHIDAAVAADR